jgi:hypothetical protein
MRRLIIPILLLMISLAHQSLANDRPFPKLWSGFSTSLNGRSAEQKELLSEDTYPPPSRILAGGGE